MPASSNARLLLGFRVLQSNPSLQVGANCLTQSAKRYIGVRRADPWSVPSREGREGPAGMAVKREARGRASCEEGVV